MDIKLVNQLNEADVFKAISKEDKTARITQARTNRKAQTAAWHVERAKQLPRAKAAFKALDIGMKVLIKDEGMHRDGGSEGYIQAILRPNSTFTNQPIAVLLTPDRFAPNGEVTYCSAEEIEVLSSNPELKEAFLKLAAAKADIKRLAK
jgi:hypothetical protein